MNNAYLLQISDGNTHQEYRVPIHAHASFHQLHQVISSLYHQNENVPFTFLLNQVPITWNQKAIHHPLVTYCHDHCDVIYLYDHVSTQFNIHMTLLESDNPGFCHYQSVKNCSSSLINEDEILAQLCEMIRSQLMKRKLIAPYLFLSKIDHMEIPYYLDALDHGLELMIFPSMQDFTRSILYSSNEDPDLLFTDAYTIDFLFEDIATSELTLYQHHNLCFKNRMGQLPDRLNNEDKNHLLPLLNHFYNMLIKQPKLPQLQAHEMLLIDEQQMQIAPLPTTETTFTPYMINNDHQHLLSYPHTNEQIRLFLNVIPHAFQTIEVKLCAMNDHFHKECKLTMHSITTFHDEVSRFLIQLCKERGLPEQFHLYSRNLYQIIAPICETLQIKISLHKQNTMTLNPDFSICNTQKKHHLQSNTCIEKQWS